MSKIKLHYTEEYNSFTAYYYKQFMSQFFDLQPYDHTQHCENILINDFSPNNLTKIKASLETCRYIILDNLQEIFYDQEWNLDLLEPFKEKILMFTIGANVHPWLNIVKVPNWFWYFESPWYYSRNYHLYTPNLADDPKLFFMPIRKTSIGRELLYNYLDDMLEERSIYSYVERGKILPGIPDEHKEDQRWFNSEWYDNTLFSVVNEDSFDYKPRIFTEKTCKPLAFHHPFILLAQQGVLKMIQDAGFETFPELFDESYDNVPSIQERAKLVNTQIRSFDISQARSNIVVEKLKHNHDRFFDQNLVFDCIKKEVVDPLIDFLTSK
jgi:hypothetical protein